MIHLKSENEIQAMKDAGRLAAEALACLIEKVKPGATTAYLDKTAEDFIAKRGGRAAFKGYRGYPASICTSLNGVVVHGIPSENEVIKETDLVSIDLGVEYKGYYGDIAWTVVMEEASENARRLAETTKRSLFAGIEKALPGGRLFDISSEIQRVAEQAGFNVVRQFVGHGIGKEMHEDPQVPNYGKRGRGILLKPGIVLAIEPMVNEGTWEVYVDNDHWTVRTVDGKLSAHFEHTIAVTESGPEILTYHEKFL